MNIRQGDTVLLRTGSSRVVHVDQWSVGVESSGLAPNGDVVTFYVAMSRGELANIVTASKRA